MERSSARPQVRPPTGNYILIKDHAASANTNIRFSFNGSFNVHIFIGHIDKDHPERFLTKKNEVGYSGIFASDRDAPCANCLEQQEEGVIYQDAVPLTMSLTRHLISYKGSEGPEQNMRTLQSLEPRDVVPFLKQHLKWTITDTASRLLDDPQQMKDADLKISVWDRIFDLPTPDHRLGLYHAAELHQEATETIPGGYGYTWP